MARRFVSLIFEGVTFTTVVVAFAVSGAVAAPLTVQSLLSADQITQAQPLQGTRMRSSAIGGPADLLVVQPGTTLPEMQGSALFFRPETPRLFYPGTLSPTPQDIFQRDQFPHAIKLWEVPAE